MDDPYDKDRWWATVALMIPCRTYISLSRAHARARALSLSRSLLLSLSLSRTHTHSLSAYLALLWSHPHRLASFQTPSTAAGSCKAVYIHHIHCIYVICNMYGRSCIAVYIHHIYCICSAHLIALDDTSCDSTPLITLQDHVIALQEERSSDSTP
jgi:hypothetical protein